MKTVLPAKAMAKMDFRLVPDQDPDDILEKLKAHLKAQGFEDVQVKKLSAAEPVVTPIDGEFVQRRSERSARISRIKSPRSQPWSAERCPCWAP